MLLPVIIIHDTGAIAEVVPVVVYRVWRTRTGIGRRRRVGIRPVKIVIPVKVPVRIAAVTIIPVIIKVVCVIIIVVIINPVRDVIIIRIIRSVKAIPVTVIITVGEVIALRAGFSQLSWVLTIDPYLITACDSFTTGAITVCNTHRAYRSTSIAFYLSGRGTPVVSTIINDSGIINNGSMVINIYTAATIYIVAAHIWITNISARHKRPVSYGYIHGYTDGHTRA